MSTQEPDKLQPNDGFPVRSADYREGFSDGMRAQARIDGVAVPPPPSLTEAAEACAREILLEWPYNASEPEIASIILRHFAHLQPFAAERAKLEKERDELNALLNKEAREVAQRGCRIMILESDLAAARDKIGELCIANKDLADGAVESLKRLREVEELLDMQIKLASEAVNKTGDVMKENMDLRQQLAAATEQGKNK